MLKVIDDEKLQANAKTVGAALKAVLDRLHQKYEIIGEVRAHGLMLAVELVSDRRSKAPAAKETAEIFEKTRENGIVVSKSGANRNILRMVPPMCIKLEDVAWVEDALDRCFAGY